MFFAAATESAEQANWSQEAAAAAGAGITEAFGRGTVDCLELVAAALWALARVGARGCQMLSSLVLLFALVMSLLLLVEIL